MDNFGAPVPGAPAPSSLSKEHMIQQNNQLNNPNISQQAAGGGGPYKPGGATNQSDVVPKLQQTSNMYSQLENMMNAVKKEAKSLEAVKQKIREMDSLKQHVSELRGKLMEAEAANKSLQQSLEVSEEASNQIRGDMQRLNDLYSKEHEAYSTAQQRVLQLEADVRGAANEVQFYQKEAQRIPDLRKKNQALISQIGTMQKMAEDEKSVVAQTTASLEAKLAAAAAEKADQTKQFWLVADEVKQLKQKLADKEALTADADNIIRGLKQAAATAYDREGMSSEEHLSLQARTTQQVNQFEADLAAARAESDSLRDILTHKEDQAVVLHAKLRNIEEMRQAEKAEIKGKIAGLTETISALKSKNHELEREASEAQHQLGLVGGDVSRYAMEVENLQAEMSRAEVAKKQREADFKRQLDAQVHERDDALEKLKKATSNFEAMQAEARSGQARYWEELQRVKEAEAQLVDEAEKLAQELEEKSTKLVMVEAERTKLEEYMRGEISGAMQMTSALRGELERRLEELTAARKEVDEAKADKIANDEKMEEMKKMMERQESNFKRTLETDRNKISGEIKAKMQKLRGLEIEKQELLMETSNLMKQVEATQKDLNEARSIAEESKATARDAQMKVQDLIDQNETLTKKADTAVQSQDELREHANRLELSFKEDIGRLDALVKESKKAAAQQVLEITDRVKSANEEVDMVKAQMKQAAENEKKALEAAETARVQLEIAAKSHEDMQKQMATDMTTMRRELQDNRTKQKINNESKTKMEMEVMNARMEATKAENEVIKLTEWCREIDTKMTQANADVQKFKLERNELDRDLKKLRLKHVELEESVAKKTAANEAFQKDMAKMEREGLAQARTLRLQLKTTEQELGELKIQVPMLQKELLEGKNSFEKMQSSTNDTVNGLLEELRSTEDALSGERRKNQQEIDTMRSKIRELNTSLEKANEHIRDNIDRTKHGNHDREVRVLQLEQELERIKQLVISKEARMDELEKQHQTDRVRITELKGSLDNAERSIADGRTTLELEQSQRARLEARIKAFTDSERMRDDSDHYTPRVTPSDDNAGLTPSSIEKRTQLLYGDVGDPEPDYDQVHSKYQLDHDSVTSVIGSDKNKPSPAVEKSKKKKIIESGIAGDDEDFMAMEQSRPNPNRGSYDNRLEAPDEFTLEEAKAGNAAVDRVGQALAARAAAESTKANLKLANAKKAEERAVHRSSDDLHSMNKSGKSMVQGVRDMVTSASTSEVGGDVFEAESAHPNAHPNDVEDSIQRTQMFLRQRLAARASAKIEAPTSASSNAPSKAGKYGEDMLISEEQAAAIAAKEARRIAEMAYQGSRRTQENDENVAEDNGESYHMDTPHLSPARPKNSINGGYSTKALGGGRIVYEDEEDSLSKARVSLPQINRNI